MEILVARQPVFDRREQLYGYDLVLRGQSGAIPQNGEPLPEQLVADAFLGIGIDRVAEGRRAFVTVDRDMLLGGSVRLLPPERVILQLSGRLGVDEEMLKACDTLVWNGYRFALAGDNPSHLPDELLRIAEVVKVDVGQVDPKFLPELCAWLRQYHVRLLALHVRHRADRDACLKLGFELFQGYRHSAPETLTRRDLAIEHVGTFRLLKLVRDPATPDAEIEELLRRDVALSYKLLRMVNSAAMGGRDVWSIGHALRLLGREQVAKWLSLLLVTDSTREGVRAELVHTALVRARLCELLADETGLKKARGPLFLVGMFSLLDQLLETPMEVLAQNIELAPDVKLALLERGDFYGSVLALVEAYEAGRWEEVDALAASVGVSVPVLGQRYLEALSWASELSKSNDEAAKAPAAAAAPAAKPAAGRARALR